MVRVYRQLTAREFARASRAWLSDPSMSLHASDISVLIFTFGDEIVVVFRGTTAASAGAQPQQQAAGVVPRGKPAPALLGRMHVILNHVERSAQTRHVEHHLYL